MATPPSDKLDFTAGGHGEPDVWLPRLHRLLADQIELASRIGAIDLRKAVALAGGDMETYLATLDERQPVIDELTALNEELRPFADRFTLLAASLKDEQREAVFAQAGRLDAALAAITRQDEVEARVIAQRRDQAAQELAGIRTGHAALGAYAPPPPVAPQSHDQDA